LPNLELYIISPYHMQPWVSSFSPPSNICEIRSCSCKWPKCTPCYHSVSTSLHSHPRICPFYLAGLRGYFLLGTFKQHCY
jgi:hypothetical protein